MKFSLCKGLIRGFILKELTYYYDDNDVVESLVLENERTFELQHFTTL